MYKRILLATDGSKLSELAVVSGIALAKETGAVVIGLTVTPAFHIFTYEPEMLEDTQEQFALNKERYAQSILDSVMQAARDAEVPCTIEHIVSDHPYEAIIDCARQNVCDLIVMAAHGRRGIKGVLLGSETQKVLVHSSIPVLVYR